MADQASEQVPEVVAERVPEQTFKMLQM